MLYKHFEFVDREKRALINIKADIISFYPELLNAEKIEVIDDHFGQGVLLVEAIQIGAEGIALRPVADRVPTGVGAHFAEAARVVVAARAEV